MARTQSIRGFNPKPWAVFRLGYYSRDFRPTDLDEALAELTTEIPADVFNGLHQAVLGGGGSPKILAAMANHALAGALHPYRVLYDLGAALGDFHVHRSPDGGSPNSQRVWECVLGLPKYLTKNANCLNELLPEATAGQDLAATINRVVNRRIEMGFVLKDRANNISTRRFFPPGSLRRDPDKTTMEEFIAAIRDDLGEAHIPRRLSRELSSSSPQQESARQSVFVPSLLQKAILKALDGKALPTKALAIACKCDEPELFKPGGIKELMAPEVNLVAHKETVGYYRPDAPPPEAIILRGNNPTVTG